MPDWSDLIRKSLEGIQLSGEEQDEVVSEFRGYLEDRYEELLRTGVSESAALANCGEELKGLRGARRSIERARGEALMNRRTRTLWLPGFVSMAATSVLLMILEYLFFFHANIGVTYQLNFTYGVWLVLLPLCGGAGALLSRRGEGGISTRIVVSLFPALAMLCVFLLVILFDLIVNRNGYIVSHPQIMLQMIGRWILVPGVALSIGALPFCRTERNVRRVSAS